jgi:hypothetical protein
MPSCHMASFNITVAIGHANALIMTARVHTIPKADSFGRELRGWVLWNSTDQSILTSSLRPYRTEPWLCEPNG